MSKPLNYETNEFNQLQKSHRSDAWTLNIKHEHDSSMNMCFAFKSNIRFSFE